MRLIPMNFRLERLTAGKIHKCYSLQFPPTTPTVEFLQTTEFTNMAPSGDDLNCVDVTNNFKPQVIIRSLGY